MAFYQEDPDHLTQLANRFRHLSRRTEKARYAAIGPSDFGRGNAHDPDLDEQIDFFYRRWVKQVESEREYMEQSADNLERARETYKLVDQTVRTSAEPQPQRRRGVDK